MKPQLTLVAPEAKPPPRWMRLTFDAFAVIGVFEVLRLGLHLVLRAVH